MPRLIAMLAVLLNFKISLAAASPEPIIGTWTLSTQTVDGHKVDNDPLTLRVYQAGGALEFAFSVPVNGIHFVSMKFTAVHLDGSAGAVENVRNEKIGTVKITRASSRSYKAVIEGSNRPKAVNTLTLSSDGQTLTSDSENESAGKGPLHVVQVFSRH